MNEQTEVRAQEIAQYNPSHAIEGWYQGHLAYGENNEAAVYQRALEIQQSWRVASPNAT